MHGPRRANAILTIERNSLPHRKLRILCAKSSQTDVARRQRRGRAALR